MTQNVAADPTQERKTELLNLLRHDCGSCHGLRLQGGLGPALTPDSLTTRDFAALEAVILHGVPGTPMPPWRGLLNGTDARWLAKAIKRGVSEEGRTAGVERAQ